MRVYKEIVSRILNEGEEKIGRNGKTLSITGAEFKHDMRKGFPILTIRQMSLKHSITELRFFIQGLQDVRWLQIRGCTFWDKWRSIKGDIFNLGPIYGSQWRDWNECGIDQLAETIKTLKLDPLNRRLLISAWNPDEIKNMALPPCHDSFQLISNGKHLDLIWRQRSCDVAIGLPYDILLYGLLLKLISRDCNLISRHLIGYLGDTHIYEAHFKLIDELMFRQPKILPELHFKDNEDIFSWAASDIESQRWDLNGYTYHPKMKFEVVA